MYESINPSKAAIANNIKFDSISQAAKHFNLNAVALCNHLKKHNGSIIFKGVEVRYEGVNAEPYKIRPHAYSGPIGKKASKNCPVYCETLNKTFDTIKEASKFAHISEWTMGLKMEVKGQFIDKNGNVYKRLRPMNTNNLYNTSSDHCLRTFTKKQKSTTIKPICTSSLLETTKPGEKVNIPVTETIIPSVQEIKQKSAKDHLKDAMQSLIDSDKYNEASAVLNILKDLK